MTKVNLSDDLENKILLGDDFLAPLGTINIKGLLIGERHVNHASAKQEQAMV
jgi:hypothetical protein